MSWKDKLSRVKLDGKEMIGGSFRGIPFYVESAERTGGRRIVTHEYPFRNMPYREDMGMKARGFPIEAYVLGPNYLEDKESLIASLENDIGPGELIHPYYGPKRVVAGDFSVKESTREGGFAKFTIEFLETDRASQPVAKVDASAKVAASAAALATATAAEFLRKYSPGTLTASLSDQLRSATLSINNVVSKARMEAQTVASLKKRITDFEDSIESLVNTPESLLSGLVDLFTDTPSGILDVYNFDAGVRPPSSTATREQEQDCFDALQRLIQRSAVTQAATLAPDEDYDSFESATAARDAITDLLDDQADNAADDVYPSLLQLRADLVKAVPGADSDLAHLVEHTPNATTPSLVLAFQLYGNLELEDDLITRNHIERPGFISGGVPLEVLSD